MCVSEVRSGDGSSPRPGALTFSSLYVRIWPLGRSCESAPSCSRGSPYFAVPIARSSRSAGRLRCVIYHTTHGLRKERAVDQIRTIAGCRSQRLIFSDSLPRAALPESLARGYKYASPTGFVARHRRKHPQKPQ